MAGYRHVDHAGNFADVHKHVLLRMLIREMKNQPGPITYIETHAGVGWYDLPPGGEWENGIGRLLGRDHLPGPVADYVAACSDGYPGSPMHAAELLGDEDRLVLIERDADTALRLAQRLECDPRCKVLTGDGYQRVRSRLPRAEDRGLLLIDPPYVEEGDYADVAALLAEVTAAWPMGVLLAWHPVWRDGREQALYEVMGQQKLAKAIYLRIETGGQEMAGSGMIVVNPPAGFMQDWMPVSRGLSKVLGSQ